MALKLLSNFGFSFKSHYFCDNFSKSLVQRAFEKILQKSEQLFTSARVPNRCILNKSSALLTSPKERVFKSVSRFYRPGLLNEATARWFRESIASTVAKNFRQRSLQKGSGLCFVGFVLANKNSLLTAEEELEGFTFAVRDVFSEVSWDNQQASSVLRSISLKDLQIGNLISKGSFAAVHSAKYIGENHELFSNKNTLVDSLLVENDLTDFISNDKVQENTESDSKLFISHSDGIENTVLQNGNNNEDRNHSEDNLAVKMMFNYDVESNAYAIWNAMYKETLPLSGDFALDCGNRYSPRRKKLKPHPNIVEMYCAFEDQAVLLPGALGCYPDALPVRLQENGCGRNMTLFLVMKRYDTSLKDFLTRGAPQPNTSLLLLVQLLEAVAHLFQNGVAHRDLKADNILLELSQGSASPRLVVADFGCSTETLLLHYTSRDLNAGNMSLMAPEVVNATPGPVTFLDFSRSDLWSSGTLAYEMYGGHNPFSPPRHSGPALQSGSYDDDQLPRMPDHTQPVVKKLVKDMLRVNPKKRPSPSFAATVCQLLLHAPPPIRYGKENSRKEIPKFLLEISARTFLESLAKIPLQSKTEFQLRHTFCTRVQYSEVLRGFLYIQEAYE